jgi:hypothetical protein
MKLSEFHPTSPNGVNVDMKQSAPILRDTIAVVSDCITHQISRRLNMLSHIARWAHNVLLASMGLLTIALVVWAT